ncbi:ECF transporter S component [Acidaminobacter hydrogenoformans]|uniref:Uncharacterized membrane protein n=1 Tax=Acidaminobacter hydrogenoformans DSM 2784 TaxID=1120920 RepID=A0A1G5RT46_9FIRM|nr:ECF transporter S component [Acidaminobacter hydrogenoformans]SCZ77295.1 Uncharacterized membrane protein [Acidaminobacter hydrogenoformans DSM 2784]
MTELNVKRPSAKTEAAVGTVEENSRSMTQVAAEKPRSVAREVTLNGLLIALVFVSTYLIQIRLPVSMNGGLIHMGNVALFTVALVFGKRKGAMAGAFGMGLFDLVSGWVAWAPFTFVVRGVMGYLIGRFSEGFERAWWKAPAAVVLGGLWMLAGYYATEGILYGNWIAPVTSIPGNLTQLALGAVVAIPFSGMLKSNAIKFMK